MSKLENIIGISSSVSPSGWSVQHQEVSFKVIKPAADAVVLTLPFDIISLCGFLATDLVDQYTALCML